MSRAPMIAALLILAAPCVYADEPASGPLKVLYVTGGGYHDYPAQAQIISEGLESRANVRVTVKMLEGGLNAPTRHPAYEGSDWAAGYDVVIHNICNTANADDPQWIENIARAHREGTAGVFLHCSMHCYRVSQGDTWRQLVGVTSRNHEAHHPITVKRLEHEHPVMRPFPQEWITPKGELYRIEKVWDGVTVLASGQASEMKDHPVIWVHTYGDGRIFGTTIGHHNETVATDEYLGLLTRGILWACGKLDEEGSPVAGYGPPTEE